MTTGIKSAGVDLASIFDPYQSGTTKARTSGIKDNGNDLSNIFANIIYGSAAAVTGIESEGADLNTLYAKIGTANYPLPIDGANFVAYSSGTISSAMDSNIQIYIKSDGTYTVTCVGNGAATGPNASGTWLPSGGSVSDYQVQYVWSQTSSYPTGPATVTNGASTYSACTTNRLLEFDAIVAQTSGLDKGSVGNVALNLKYVPSGHVTTTNFGINVESVGSA